MGVIASSVTFALTTVILLDLVAVELVQTSLSMASSREENQ